MHTKRDFLLPPPRRSSSLLPPSLLHLAQAIRDPDTLHLATGDEIGIANGLAGIALFPLALADAFPEEEWLEVAKAYMLRIAAETRKHPLAHPGMYHGSCGVALVLSLLAQQDERYRNASQTLQHTLVRQVTDWDWRGSPILDRQENFEVIGGAAGILRFLLSIAQDTTAQAAIEQVLSYLIWASAKQERWMHRPERLGPKARARYPDGYTDLGLAHGIAGPLAVLALVARQGYSVPGLHDALDRWATWLVEQRLSTEWGIDWPSVLPVGMRASDCPPARSAWCYGVPGIARALWLAGNALHNDALRLLACEALASTLRRPEKHIDEPQICHGVAGLLLICQRFANDDPSCRPWLLPAIAQLTDVLQSRWDKGYPQMAAQFLSGAIGGALTLLSRHTDRLPGWDHVLVIS